MSASRFGVNSSTGPKYVTAALLTRMSGGPSRAVVSSTSRARSSGRDRSAALATAVPPAPPRRTEPPGDLRPDPATRPGHQGHLPVQDTHKDIFTERSVVHAPGKL